MKKLLVVFSIMLFMFPALALSHGGGLDSNGGHTDRKTGKYHKHRKTYSSSGKSSSSSSSGSSYKNKSSSTYSSGGSSSQKSNNTKYKHKSYPYKPYYSDKPVPSYKSPTAYKQPPKPEPTKTTEEKQADIKASQNSRKMGYYFRLSNENVGELGCNIKFHERDVSQSLEEKVKHRDGNRCVICGSTTKLEVDHRRALMNGGNNSASNLATLCDDCHAEKIKHDNSLRIKREKICGN